MGPVWVENVFGDNGPNFTSDLEGACSTRQEAILVYTLVLVLLEVAQRMLRDVAHRLAPGLAEKSAVVAVRVQAVS